MPFETASEALNALEAKNREFITEARAVAFQLGQGGSVVTVDDIRKQCPPPEGVDPRVMGAILRKPDWTNVGYRNSTRKTCHKRPIAEFKLAEFA